jgi:hypothetical protein
MRHRVTCTTKHEKHELITHLGAYNTANVWIYFNETEVIRMINYDGDTFYVERPTGHVVEVIVAERGGRVFLKTEADGEKPNNLLSLPDCPKKQTSITGVVSTVIAAASHGSSSWC